MYLWFNNLNWCTAKCRITTASLLVDSIITEFKTPEEWIFILASIVVVLGLKKITRRTYKIIN